MGQPQTYNHDTAKVGDHVVDQVCGFLKNDKNIF
jgi:hypothetical protein